MISDFFLTLKSLLFNLIFMPDEIACLRVAFAFLLLGGLFRLVWYLVGVHHDSSI